MLTNQRIRAIRALNTRGVRLLHIADVVVIYATLMLITAAMSLFPPRNPWSDVDDRYWWSYGVVALMNLAVFYFGGIYDREPRLRSRVSLPKIVALVWVASLLAGVISLMLNEYVIPRSILIIFAMIAPLGVAANRLISQRLQSHALGPARVLLVGTDDEVGLALRHLRQADQVDIAGSTGGVDELEKYVEETAATDVLLLDSMYLEELYTGSLERIEAKGVGALLVVGAHDSLLGLRNVGEIGGIPFVVLSAHVLPRSQERLKRFMDLGILTLALPIALPVLIFMTAYVGIAVRSPVLFVQDRVGKDGTTFPMMKYRSMPTNAEAETGPVQAEIHDPRVIRGMHWVRQMRLDELPQLWNVVRGQMSIVGPRPERPEEMAAWERKVPGYRRRHQVPPGITGLAQVYGYAQTDPEYKLGHDLHYLANWSPILDLQIIARSAWVILSRRG